MEACQSRKAVITVDDSGDLTELVKHGANGWVCADDTGEIAAAMTEAFASRAQTRERGDNAYDSWTRLDINWASTVVNALRELGHEVAIYRTETGEAASYPALPDTTVLPSGSAMEDEWLRTADLVFANVGDHYGFHGGIFELARKRQFIGIMHDWFVLNLFWGMLRVEGRQQDAPRIIQGLYGQEAGELCAAATSETIMQVAATHFPMTEWAVADMLGCIIHSEFYRAKVQARCPGPVHKLSLAYPAPT
ncbi:unnamed protein product [Cylicocyclus nassatus]|uniref:Uncharacterized protein n=1 Tax=Cylicocyclus nassatus TaxID=53992 RepID=A0AA36M451_CYLNA|nr:unnamed protein product [Cylicocyclus nassatus]